VVVALDTLALLAQAGQFKAEMAVQDFQVQFQVQQLIMAVAVAVETNQQDTETVARAEVAKVLMAVHPVRRTLCMELTDWVEAAAEALTLELVEETKVLTEREAEAGLL
jgi:hypothetical protein